MLFPQKLLLPGENTEWEGKNFACRGKEKKFKEGFSLHTHGPQQNSLPGRLWGGLPGSGGEDF